MFFDAFSDLVRILVVGPLAYLWLVALVRVSGKRTLAQLNAFDFIVTVALGSTLATVLLSSTVSWSEGALALGLLALLQFIVAAISSRLPFVQRVVTSAPTLLLRDGHVITETLIQERVTEASLRQAVRAAGIGGLEKVAAVVLESNGKLSVIPASEVGSASALEDVTY